MYKNNNFQSIFLEYKPGLFLDSAKVGGFMEANGCPDKSFVIVNGKYYSLEISAQEAMRWHCEMVNKVTNGQ